MDIFVEKLNQAFRNHVLDRFDFVYFSDIPILALRCKLENIVPVNEGENYHPDFIFRMRKLLTDKQVRVQITRRYTKRYVRFHEKKILMYQKVLILIIFSTIPLDFTSYFLLFLKGFHWL